jgi:hypothetical protein
MKYFPIERIQRAIEHLEQFHSKWVIVPLVFAVNGVSEAEEINITAEDQAGADEFLQQYFNGALIGLPPFERGVNTLRPRFRELISTLRSQGKEEDYVLHQRQGLWANAYSSRGYREMRNTGVIRGAGGSSRFELAPEFWDAWEENLPDTFRFEELLVWLYAFHGVPDEIDRWEDLFIDFQEKHLGRGNRFPRGYEIRFNVENSVPWEDVFLDERTTYDEYQQELMPSLFTHPEITAGYFASEIEDDDEYLVRVQELLADGFAGVIFTGSPGTSKSWYAAQIGMKLVDDDPERIRFTQFHASYQYEDFVEGFVPVDGGGFKLVPKHLLEMCAIAEGAGGKLCVLVIDELSRSDPARVFGEALTYIEMTKRGRKFHLSSGKEISIPKNLVFLATMNPMDRGVDEVDAALERRFAKIAMNPNGEMLRQYLESKGIEEGLRNRVVSFFNYLNGNKNQLSRLGHAYFYEVEDEAGLMRLWQNQLYFHFEKAFRLDSEGFQDIESKWNKIFAVRPAAAAAPEEPAEEGNE